MKIGIYSKFVHPGGSEMRSAYLCTFIKQLRPDAEVVLLSSDMMKYEIKKLATVPIVEYAYDNFDFSTLDHLIIVNSDSQIFSRAEYWKDKLSNVKVAILFNYMPALKNCMYVPAINCKEMRLLVSNTESQVYASALNYPCMILESVVDIKKFMVDKIKSSKIRIGRHAHNSSSKFSPRMLPIIARLNEQYFDRIAFDFIGYPSKYADILADFIKQHTNITLRQPFTKDPVDYLKELDIFWTCTTLNHTEAWSRSICEAMASGCPIVCNDKGGNKDQVLHGFNGFLCPSEYDMEQALGLLITDDTFRKQCGEKSRELAMNFNPLVITDKLMRYINA
jgi:glycosyltransferase involved in cell wall biosynthesis